MKPNLIIPLAIYSLAYSSYNVRSLAHPTLSFAEIKYHRYQETSLSNTRPAQRTMYQIPELSSHLRNLELTKSMKSLKKLNV